MSAMSYIHCELPVGLFRPLLLCQNATPAHPKGPEHGRDCTGSVFASQNIRRLDVSVHSFRTLPMQPCQGGENLAQDRHALADSHVV